MERMFSGIAEQVKWENEIENGGKCPGCTQGRVSKLLEIDGKECRVTIDCPLFKLNGENCEYGREVHKVIQDEIYKRLAEKGVPKRHLKPADEIDTNQPAYKATKNWDGWGNLTLCGNVGTGKSFAAVCALRRWVGLRTSRSIDAGAGLPYIRDNIRYTVLPYVEWKRAFEICDNREFREKAKKAAILVLDELGAESLNEYSTAILNDLLSHRYDNDALATIITTNLTPDALEQRYGPRMMDRLSGEEGVIVVVDGKNMRFER
jgi:DNA replication protein DnaC